MQHRNQHNQSPPASALPVITGAPLDGPADCTLACDEGHLTAHKIMLCAHSKYLQDILGKFPNAEHPIVILTELNITDIKILVNYMYTGELVITNDGSPSSLLRAAQILKIDSLTDFDDDEEQQRNSPQLQQQQPHSPQLQHQHHQQQQQNSPQIHRQNSPQIQRHNSPQIHRQKMKHQRRISPEPSPSMSPPSRRSTPPAQSSPKRPQPISVHKQHQQQMHQQQQQQQQQSKESINGSNNKIRCHLCNIGLSDVKCLYRHVLTRHLPEKWGYKCEFCDREFSRDDHLMRHYPTKHTNMEFHREKIRETRRLNREMAKNFHDQISKLGGIDSIRNELSL